MRAPTTGCKSNVSRTSLRVESHGRGSQPGVTLQLVVDIGLDILRPLAQSRQDEGPHVDTGKQIFTIDGSLTSGAAVSSSDCKNGLDPTKLESKLAEVLGLAGAAKGATEKVRRMLDDDEQDLAEQLTSMHDEASETEQRCTEVADELDGKKTATNPTPAAKSSRPTRHRLASLNGPGMFSSYIQLFEAKPREPGEWPGSYLLSARLGPGLIARGGSRCGWRSGHWVYPRVPRGSNS